MRDKDSNFLHKYMYMYLVFMCVHEPTWVQKKNITHILSQKNNAVRERKGDIHVDREREREREGGEEGKGRDRESQREKEGEGKTKTAREDARTYVCSHVHVLSFLHEPMLVQEKNITHTCHKKTNAIRGER